MMNRLLAQCGVLFLAFANIHTAKTQELSHDPFTRPALIVPLASATNSPGTSAPVVDLPWAPKLTAVMQAGKQSLVTIDGEVMKIGEKKNGYQLIVVGDREAVFIKDHKRTVIKMDAQTAEPERDLRKK
ncbi:MAG: hypothetical protein ABL885_06645 [Methylophilaceae bacterium]